MIGVRLRSSTLRKTPMLSSYPSPAESLLGSCFASWRMKETGLFVSSRVWSRLSWLSLAAWKGEKSTQFYMHEKKSGFFWKRTWAKATWLLPVCCYGWLASLFFLAMISTRNQATDQVPSRKSTADFVRQVAVQPGCDGPGQDSRIVNFPYLFQNCWSWAPAIKLHLYKPGQDNIRLYFIPWFTSRRLQIISAQQNHMGQTFTDPTKIIESEDLNRAFLFICICSSSSIAPVHGNKNAICFKGESQRPSQSSSSQNMFQILPDILSCRTRFQSGQTWWKKN